MRSIALITLFAVAACESYSAGDFAAGVGCDARESACIKQCEERFGVGSYERLEACRASCEENTGNLCK